MYKARAAAPTVVCATDWRDLPSPSSSSAAHASSHPPSSSSSSSATSSSSSVGDLLCGSIHRDGQDMDALIAAELLAPGISTASTCESTMKRAPPSGSPRRYCPSPSPSLRGRTASPPPSPSSSSSTTAAGPSSPALSSHTASASSSSSSSSTSSTCTSPPPVHPLSTSPARSFSLDLAPHAPSSSASTSSVKARLASLPSSSARTAQQSASSAKSTPANWTEAGAQPASWWQWLLGRVWVAAKMCVMFSLVSVLWLILALPTIDQKLQALFRFFFRKAAFMKPLWTMPDDGARESDEKASHKQKARQHAQSPVASKQKNDGTAHEESSLTIDNADRGDQTSDDGQSKPRLNGSQELRKSEEGTSGEPSVALDEHNQSAAATQPNVSANHAPAEDSSTKSVKSKRKRIVKSVRWSDDPSSDE